MQAALQGLDSVALVAVVPGTPQGAARLRQALNLTCAIVCDPDWRVHHALGLTRGGLRATWLSPATWRTYARLLAKGGRLRRPREDASRLGGVALLDPDGSVIWRYVSKDAADYAPPAEIVAAVTG